MTCFCFLPLGFVGAENRADKGPGWSLLLRYAYLLVALRFTALSSKSRTNWTRVQSSLELYWPATKPECWSDTEFSESLFILYRAQIPLSAEFFTESAAGGIVNFNWTSARRCLSTYIWTKGSGGAYSSYSGHWSSECGQWAGTWAQKCLHMTL